MNPTSEVNDTTGDEPDFSSYDIDPAEFSYDIENRWRDTSNNVTNHLGRVEGTDMWILYRSWQSGPNDSENAIKVMGDFTIKPVELDAELITDRIREGAEKMDDGELKTVLSSHADELAQCVIEQWELDSSYAINEAVYDGLANFNGHLTWANTEQGLYFTVEQAVKDFDFGEWPDGEHRDIVRNALEAAIDKHRAGWRNPQAEFIGRLEFDVQSWEVRAIMLYHHGVYGGMLKTARVQALRETGLKQSEIADTLGVDPSTVSRHKDRSDEWLERAEWTVRNVAANDIGGDR